MDAPMWVGFDLDMTLIDSRPGIAATYRALTAESGVHVDAEVVVARLGPPLRTELANWFPPAEVDAAVALFRSLYPRYAVEPTPPLPGAREALHAVRARGGRVLVVTSKLDRLARLHLDRLDLPVDALAGDRYAEGKAAAIREVRALAYVGDHTADMRAARAAGVPGVGVATGPCTVEELRAAGAAEVMPDLTGFPGWLDATGSAAGIPVGSGP